MEPGSNLRQRWGAAEPRGLTRKAQYLLVAAAFLAAVDFAYVLVRGVITAAEGGGDPEIMWPALGVILLIVVALSALALRFGRRLFATASERAVTAFTVACGLGVIVVMLVRGL